MVVKWIAGEESMEPITIALMVFFVAPIVFLVLVSLLAIFKGEGK